jgi:hypothetical protein
VLKSQIAEINVGELPRAKVGPEVLQRHQDDFAELLGVSRWLCHLRDAIDYRGESLGEADHAEPTTDTLPAKPVSSSTSRAAASATSSPG